MVKLKSVLRTRNLWFHEYLTIVSGIIENNQLVTGGNLPMGVFKKSLFLFWVELFKNLFHGSGLFFILVFTW